MNSANQQLAFYLELLRDKIIPLSVLPEIGLFLTQKKKHLRLTVEESHFVTVAAKLNQIGVTFSHKKIFSIYRGNTWYDIKFEKHMSEADLQTKYDVRFLICCSQEGSDPCEVLEAEEKGQIDKAGALLGYPNCCINAIDELNSSGDRWPLLLLERTIGQANGYANRLASVWGGTSFTGELFPCSLNCERTVSLGKMAENALWELGLHRLAREIQYMSQRPVLVNNQTGEISAINESNIKLIENDTYQAVFFK